jgi:hypothetical protein
MDVQEIDALFNWVKCNVWDMPKDGDDIAFIDSDSGPYTGPDISADEIQSTSAWVDRNAPAEYDFPLSLLEHILGLDRIEN